MEILNITQIDSDNHYRVDFEDEGERYHTSLAVFPCTREKEYKTKWFALPWNPDTGKCNPVSPIGTPAAAEGDTVDEALRNCAIQAFEQWQEAEKPKKYHTAGAEDEARRLKHHRRLLTLAAEERARRGKDTYVDRIGNVWVYSEWHGWFNASDVDPRFDAYADPEMQAQGAKRFYGGGLSEPGPYAD